MYIVTVKKNGSKFIQENFTSEKEYNSFVQGLICGLEISNLKYTYNEMICEMACVTELIFNIL